MLPLVLFLSASLNPLCSELPGSDLLLKRKSCTNPIYTSEYMVYSSTASLIAELENLLKDEDNFAKRLRSTTSDPQRAERIIAQGKRMRELLELMKKQQAEIKNRIESRKDFDGGKVVERHNKPPATPDKKP